MINNTLAIITGSVYCFFMVFIIVASIKRSRFGYVILFYEYFYILGLGVFPLVASLGIIDISPIYKSYESQHGGLSIATFIHILLYGVGAFCGYFVVGNLSKSISRKIIVTANFCKFNNYKWFYLTSFLSIFFNLLYFSLVGLDVALLNASSVRMGDSFGMMGLENYSFLKTLAMIGLFSVFSLPFIIAGKRLLSSFLILSIVAILLYMQSVARVIFFDTVFMFALLYFVLSKDRIRSIVLVSVSSLFILIVAMYGKEFVGMYALFAYSGEDFQLTETYDDLFSYLMSHFGHQIYSVDAGITNFFEHGPIIPKDIVLSPIGFLPSFVYSALSLDFLSYQLVDESQRLSCINTVYFSLADKCSLPPYIVGYAAYFLPFVGGFIFGFLRFFIYRVLEISWINLQNKPELLWIVLAILLVVNRIILFIPNTISFASFGLVILLVFVSYQKRRAQ